LILLAQTKVISKVSRTATLLETQCANELHPMCTQFLIFCFSFPPASWHGVGGRYIVRLSLPITTLFPLLGDPSKTNTNIGQDASRYAEIQVKTIRLSKATSYVFMRKKLFPISDNRFLALVVVRAEISDPTIFLIPSTVWAKPGGPFASRDLIGKKSDPEYG